jgi:glycine/D-amino acid oxidase-like deaminating enzyme
VALPTAEGRAPGCRTRRGIDNAAASGGDLSLARRGLPVTLIEKGDIAAGSSYGNAGLIVPSHSIPLAAPGGLRPCSPDGLPYIGRPARWENLIAATGHAMIGVSLGPVTGSLVAQLAAREAPALDLHPLRPDRFA